MSPTTKKTTKKVTKKRTPKKVTKKKTARRAVNQRNFSFDGPVYNDGVMHLSPMDLMKFELAQAKAANLAQAHVLKKQEMAEQQRQFNERMHRLRQESSQLQVASKDAAGALAVARKELSEAYNMDLERIIYDDQSGKIHVLHEEGEPTPLLEGVEPPPPPTPDTEG
jgi:homogentisate 1,2-dioxygenase